MEYLSIYFAIIIYIICNFFLSFINFIKGQKKNYKLCT